MCSCKAVATASSYISFLFAAEVKFIEHLGTKHAIENRKTVFETLVENPHNRPVTWFRNGQEIKPDDR